MPKKYHFNKVLPTHKELLKLKNKWVENLSSPQDGMWGSFRDHATHWAIIFADKMIGYACLDEENQLIQFYISPEYLPDGTAIFKQFTQELNIKKGIVGTNNLTYLSIALNFAKELEVHSHLFRENFELSLTQKEGTLKECQAEDMERVVDFCHDSLGAPKEWLTGYIGGLIENKEVFALEKDDKIIGTCEVRRSVSAAGFADIGMIVSPDYRRKGYGTYLLSKAKAIAIEWGKTPICSCEKGNMGSLKSIHNCGFVSRYQLLAIVFG